MRIDVTPRPSSTREDRLKVEPVISRAMDRHRSLAFPLLPDIVIPSFHPPTLFLLPYFSARIPAGFSPTLTEEKDVRAGPTDPKRKVSFLPRESVFLLLSFFSSSSFAHRTKVRRIGAVYFSRISIQFSCIEIILFIFIFRLQVDAFLILVSTFNSTYYFFTNTCIYIYT